LGDEALVVELDDLKEVNESIDQYFADIDEPLDRHELFLNVVRRLGCGMVKPCLLDWLNSL